jgi:hypothetical protein
VKAVKASCPKNPRRAQVMQENKLFKAIGEFIFWFSQLEFTIKARLAGALKLEEKLFDVIIGPYDFAMLCTVTKEMLSLDASEDTQKRIKTYFGECHSLNQKARLIVAHGSWTLGGVRHVSRGTLKASVHFEKPQQIDKYTAQAKLLMRSLFSLGATHR